MQGHTFKEVSMKPQLTRKQAADELQKLADYYGSLDRDKQEERESIALEMAIDVLRTK